jgi:hypothetical protein
MLTSIALMKNIEYGGGVFHIDGTHGIVKNRFPLVVFGITDRQGHFFPIAFMLTSFETSYDFDLFYEEIINLSESLDLYFNPEFIMQDASSASYLSAIKYFPNAIILMCYFHVLYNVGIKLKNLI